jgi:hypothetical protein
MPSSSSFIVGLLEEPSSGKYSRLVSSPPTFVPDSPVVFLSEPFDNPPSSIAGVGEVFTVVPRTHRFAYNDNTGRTEFVVFVTPGSDNPDLYKTLGVDAQHFLPYFRIVVDPMRSNLIRHWCNSIGNALSGEELRLRIFVSSDPILSEEFNPTAITSLGDGL